MAMLRLHRNGTVTVCHSHTPDLAAVTRQADILVSAVGQRNTITADMVKDGAVVIDVAMNLSLIHILERLLQVDAAEQALNETKQWWRAQTSPMELQTPEPALNHYINRWALYQTCLLYTSRGWAVLT